MAGDEYPRFGRPPNGSDIIGCPGLAPGPGE